MRRKIVGGLGRVALVCLGTIVSFILAEICARIFIPPLPENKGRLFFISESPEVVFEMFPNKQVIYRGVDVLTNAQGFRDDHGYEINKPPNTVRILFVGDSFTFGHGVEHRNIFCERLEHLLSQEYPEIEFESLNTGIVGANVVREVELVRYKGLMNYDPDLVILGYNIHNLERGFHNVDTSRIHRSNEFFFTKKAPNREDIQYTGPDYGIIPYDFIRKIKNKSVLLRTFVYSNELLLKIFQVRDWDRLYIEGNPDWERTKYYFRELMSDCRDAGVPGLVVMFPVLSNLNDNYPFSDVHGVVGKEMFQIGFHFLDLLPAYMGKNARSLWVHPLDRHPNAEGHRIAAEAMASYLMHQNWFTPNH